jgi:hypothetical protein
MVKEENVKLMSKMAIYEKREGKQQIAMNRFYKSDYVRWNALKAIVSSTVVFVIVVAMYILYNLDYLLINVLKMDYWELAKNLLIAYGAWVLLYWLLATIVYSVKYEKIRPSIIEYNNNLKHLDEITEKEIMKAKGGVVINDDFTDF